MKFLKVYLLNEKITCNRVHLKKAADDGFAKTWAHLGVSVRCCYVNWGTEESKLDLRKAVRRGSSSTLLESPANGTIVTWNTLRRC